MFLKKVSLNFDYVECGNLPFLKITWFSYLTRLSVDNLALEEHFSEKNSSMFFFASKIRHAENLNNDKKN